MVPKSHTYPALHRKLSDVSVSVPSSHRNPSAHDSDRVVSWVMMNGEEEGMKSLV